MRMPPPTASRSAKLWLFLLLSAVDLAMTWILVHRSRGAIYEGNPIAAWWLSVAGWVGLTAFKAATVACVLGTCTLISAHRPHASGAILSFACCTLCGVIAYSAFLSVQTTVSAPPKSDELDAELASMQDYLRQLHALRAELKEGNCSIGFAVQQLMQCERARDPRLLAILHEQYPGYSDEACLAASLLGGSLGTARNSSGDDTVRL
jgi:Domain of unknown function (DUF5658)